MRLLQANCFILSFIIGLTEVKCRDFFVLILQTHCPNKVIGYLSQPLRGKLMNSAVIATVAQLKANNLQKCFFVKKTDNFNVV